jgi:hypothetical protein
LEDKELILSLLATHAGQMKSSKDIVESGQEEDMVDVPPPPV